MKTSHTNRLFVATLIGLAFPFLTAPDSQAILIGFESAEGYSTGDLAGQPSSGTKWTKAGSNSTLLVTANEGTTGSDNGLLANSSAASGFYSFAPSNSDLGGTFSHTSSKIAFSFDYNQISLKGAGDPLVGSAIFRIGTTNGNTLRFAFWNDGTMTFSDGTGNHYAIKSGGGTFVASADTYFKVEGVLDYGTDTYTLSVNGVSQVISGDSTFDFYGTSTTADLNILASNNMNANWEPFAMDNISYAIVPEPHTAALLAFQVLGLLALRKRNRQRS